VAILVTVVIPAARTVAIQIGLELITLAILALVEVVVAEAILAVLINQALVVVV
jgi:hypothetical protein